MDKILRLILHIGFYYDESFKKYYFDYNNILYSFCLRGYYNSCYYLTRSDKNIENDFKMWGDIDVGEDGMICLIEDEFKYLIRNIKISKLLNELETETTTRIKI
jgi:hypothetical protein